MGRLAATLAAALLLLPSGGADAQMGRETFDRIAASVAQVRARDCDGGGSRSGTGFLYGDGDGLVTALHVVAGCRRIDAYFERAGGRTVSASLDRVLERVDLALLRLGEQGAGTPLPAAGNAPQANDELFVVAFFLGAPSLDDKTLRVTYGATRLSGMLPAEVADELRRSRAIDLELDIVRLDGHLLPGASGAPLFDGQGRVVAIGSGGLRSGAASISWGLPAGHLADLLRSPARQAGRATQTASLYSAPTPDSPGGASQTERVRCGGLTFVRLDTRSFRDLAATTDDPLGLQQLLEHFRQYGLPWGTEESFRFDIWMPEGEGAVVAVPDWMDRPQDIDLCRSRDPQGSIEISFGGVRLGGQWEVQGASSELELRLLRDPNWWPDPWFSYPAPTFRPDGLMVRRKAFHGPTPQPPLSRLAFETLATKGAHLFGIAAVNHAHNAPAYQQCAMYPAHPACAPVREEMRRMSQAMLAVHLSTFPIY